MRNEDQKIQEQIGKLLGSLKRVEAPGDFDFKVRARIAKGRPATTSAPWLPASVKLAMPLGLMLVVGGYFAFDSIYSSEGVNVPAVAEIPASTNPQPMAFVPSLAGDPDSASSSTIAAVTEVGKSPEPKSTVKRAAVKKTSTATPSADRGGGSVDIAGREGTTILPGGLQPNTNAAVKLETVSAGRVTAKDALSKIGVSATFSGGGWKVDSVAADSTAGRSGVKAGDTIEVLNGKALSEKATFEIGSPAKGVRVRRDGRSIIVGLRP